MISRMSLATRCTACGTVFRVVQDQLKVSEGWVRCGRCDEVFNALEGLFDLERESPPDWTPLAAAAPSRRCPARRRTATSHVDRRRLRDAHSTSPLGDHRGAADCAPLDTARRRASGRVSRPIDATSNRARCGRRRRRARLREFVRRSMRRRRRDARPTRRSTIAPATPSRRRSRLTSCARPSATRAGSGRGARWRWRRLRRCAACCWRRRSAHALPRRDRRALAGAATARCVAWCEPLRLPIEPPRRIDDIAGREQRLDAASTARRSTGCRWCCATAARCRWRCRRST